MQKSTLDFNREILFGECGALVMANPTAVLAAHFTSNAALISSAAVAGTLIGGGAFWLVARIYDQVREKRFSAKILATDLGYFTPAAVVFGFLVYDPSIYLTSHHLLRTGARVEFSVIVGQVVAFALFLACMNLYRLLLLRVRGKSL
jgi:hypothetical protein